MLFVLTPRVPAPAYFDPEQIYDDYCRREYVAALQEQQQRAQFERELALEEQRHRQALAAITQQEAARRRRQAPLRFAARAQQPCQGACGAADVPGAPTHEEILRRRQARQQEEERLSREFHERILSQIFGMPVGEAAKSAPQEQDTTTTPAASVSTLICCPMHAQGLTCCSQTSAKGKESTVKHPRKEEPQPHWSAAPERAQSLAEITSVNRAFVSLKNTFVFPSGTLEGIPDSDVPRLAYNSTNASIHAYEHALAELLTKLDSIESYGFKGVREARKQLVVKIEKALEELEEQVVERLTENASPAKAASSIPSSPAVAHGEEKNEDVQDIVMHDEAQPEVPPAVEVSEGYDVEPEPSPEVLMQEPSEPTVAVSEPTEFINLAPEETAAPAVKSASVESSIEVASLPEPEEPREPTTTTSTNSAVLPASESDEGSEIEDAVHIEISSDEEEVVDAKRDAHSETEGAFEMI